MNPTCIKTGCTVRVGDRLIHGDLHLPSKQFFLTGVPQNHNGEYFYDFEEGMHYDCEAGDFENVSKDGEYYQAFRLNRWVIPTEEFYQFLVKWSDFAIPYMLVPSSFFEKNKGAA